jgi:pyridoxamine 5'-phosphate oxidase
MNDPGVDESDLDPDPIKQFGAWFSDAREAGQPEPDAMALATTTGTGAPAVRFVLLRSFDYRGFVFHTNSHSNKGSEMAATPYAALAFRWWVVGRQVRVSGPVAQIDPTESDAYFETRPRGAQLGAWGLTRAALSPAVATSTSTSTL